MNITGEILPYGDLRLIEPRAMLLDAQIPVFIGIRHCDGFFKSLLSLFALSVILPSLIPMLCVITSSKRS